MNRKILILALAALALGVMATGARADPVTLVDNTSGQLTWNNHQLESTGNWGNFAEDVSAASYNLQSPPANADGWILSGRLQIGGMTNSGDGDTSWAEVVVSSVIPVKDTTFGWDTGLNIVFSGSSTSGSQGYGYDFWLRQGTNNLGDFHTSDVVRSNDEGETGAPNPRSVFFDFALTMRPSGAAGGTAELAVTYGGSAVGALSGAYTADLSGAYVYAALWNGESGEDEFAFLDYSASGVEGQLDLSATPEPFSMAFMGLAFAGVVGYRARKRRKEGKKL